MGSRTRRGCPSARSRGRLCSPGKSPTQGLARCDAPTGGQHASDAHGPRGEVTRSQTGARDDKTRKHLPERTAQRALRQPSARTSRPPQDAARAPRSTQMSAARRASPAPLLHSRAVLSLVLDAHLAPPQNDRSAADESSDKGPGLSYLAPPPPPPLHHLVSPSAVPSPRFSLCLRRELRWMERRSWRAHTRGAAGEEEEMKRGGVGWGGSGAEPGGCRSCAGWLPREDRHNGMRMEACASR